MRRRPFWAAARDAPLMLVVTSETAAYGYVAENRHMVQRFSARKVPTRRSTMVLP